MSKTAIKILLFCLAMQTVKTASSIPIHVKVESVDFKTPLNITLPANSTVYQLKERISNTPGIRKLYVWAQFFKLEDRKNLNNSKKLSEYGIKEGTTIFLQYATPPTEEVPLFVEIEGTTHEVEIAFNQTVADLCKLIEEKTGQPVAQKTISCRGKTWDKNYKLRNCGDLGVEDCVTLVDLLPEDEDSSSGWAKYGLGLGVIGVLAYYAYSK